MLFCTAWPLNRVFLLGASIATPRAFRIIQTYFSLFLQSNRNFGVKRLQYVVTASFFHHAVARLNRPTQNCLLRHRYLFGLEPTFSFYRAYYKVPFFTTAFKECYFTLIGLHSAFWCKTCVTLQAKVNNLLIWIQQDQPRPLYDPERSKISLE